MCQVKSFAFSAVVHLDLNPFITPQVEIEYWKSYCIVRKEFKRISRLKRKRVDEILLMHFKQPVLSIVSLSHVFENRARSYIEFR